MFRSKTQRDSRKYVLRGDSMLLAAHSLPMTILFFFLMVRPPPSSSLFPYPPLFRSPPARDALIYISANALQRLAADQRTHFGVRLHAVADAQLPCALGQLRHERFRAVAHQDRHRDGHAALAGRAVLRAAPRLARTLRDRVGHAL